MWNALFFGGDVSCEAMVEERGVVTTAQQQKRRNLDIAQAEEVRDILDMYHIFLKVPRQISRDSLTRFIVSLAQ